MARFIVRHVAALGLSVLIPSLAAAQLPEEPNRVERLADTVYLVSLGGNNSLVAKACSNWARCRPSRAACSSCRSTR